jgi:hypothetical protein
MPDGNLVVSFRNISTVVIVDRQTGALTAKLTSPILAIVLQYQDRPLTAFYSTLGLPRFDGHSG